MNTVPEKGVCRVAESDKAETILTNSTLYIQVEECLSVSSDHHSASVGSVAVGLVRTF